MTDDLENRVLLFGTMSLPNQMGMGTFYLVNDLWQEVKRLREMNDWLAQKPDSSCDSKCGYCKTGDVSQCDCGLAVWEAAKPIESQQ